MSQPEPSQRAAQRRRRIATAALRVLADAGLRGCTHRAVDAAAGLPPGSVNYHAPTRQRLLELALDELFAQDMAVVALHFRSREPRSDAEQAAALADFVCAMSAPDARHRVVARHHLLGAARTDPALRARFEDQRAAFVRFVRERFAGADADRRAELLVIVVDGLLHRQVFFDGSALADAEARAVLRLAWQAGRPAGDS